MELEIKKIFSRKLAYQLRLRGFSIVGTEPNSYKPQFDTYLFKDSVELREAMTEITQK